MMSVDTKCNWVDCDKPVAVGMKRGDKVYYRRFCSKHHKAKYGRYSDKSLPVLSANIEEIKEVFKPVDNYRCGCVRIDGKKLCVKHS